MSKESDADQLTVVSSKARLKAALALLERPNVLGYLLMAPAALNILILVAYPFFWGGWMSQTNKQIGMPWYQV